MHSRRWLTRSACLVEVFPDVLLAEHLHGDEISEPALWNSMRETIRVQVRLIASQCGTAHSAWSKPNPATRRKG